MDVVLLRWPTDQSRRAEMAERHLPRLLLVESGAIPPESDDCMEDWVSVPAGELEVRIRMACLSARAERHGPALPSLDTDGVLRSRGAWVPLPPVEARLTGALLEHFGGVVSREHLAQAGWPDGPPGRNALDVHVLRLRRRIGPLRLVIRTVRSRGYLLEQAAGELAAEA